jgi:hypothetical protein
MSLHQQRRAHSPRGVEGRINACRERLRHHHRAAQRTKAVHPEASTHDDEDDASVRLPEASRMSSVAEILSGAGRELAWLEEALTPEVDEYTPGRTGLSVKEEVGKA